MKKRFEALDAFRGICAIFVVVFHMNLVGSITELGFFRGSAIFVEFFFVLSGFVLAHGYGFREGLAFKPFMKARFFRIYPLHLFMFLVFVALEFSKVLAARFGGFSFGTEPFTNSTAPSEIIPNLLLIQSWTPFTDHLSFNYPAWSISIEFYMYVLLFFTIVLFKSYRLFSWFLISLAAFVLIYFGSDVVVDTVLRGLSCFFGGSFAYVIYRKIADINIPSVLGSIIEFALLVAIILAVQTSNEYRPIFAPLLFIVTVLFFAFESGVVSKLFKVNLLQYAGKLSYSIYMTHAAIIFCLIPIARVLNKLIGVDFAPVANGARVLDFGNSVINNLFILVILMLVVLVSHFTYKYIELTGQQLNKKTKKILSEEVIKS